MPLIDRDAEYDVVVIGAGSTGENVAGRAVRGGLSCAVVENELVGGDCSYWACMPSKGLLRPVELLDIGRAVPGMKEALGDRKLDVDAVLAKRDSIINNLDDRIKSRISKFADDTKLIGSKRRIKGEDGYHTRRLE